jgi:DNA repair exonuclease SbcCD ATPase subunit
MNVVNFGTIAIHNFKSVGDEVKFDYRDYNGMTFVKGENLDMPDLANGVGKSVIFVDALLMVLFGQLSNNVKNKEIFHRNAKTNLGWIKLQLFVNEHEWNIHCILQRSKTGNVSLSRALYEGEVCEENSVTKSSMAQTLKFISEDVLKCDADTFKNAVVLSTSNIQNFFTLPRPAKDAYLDSVFMLAAFGEVWTQIKKSANALKKELSSQREVFDGLKSNHKEIVNKSKELIREKKAKLETLEQLIKAKHGDIEELQSQSFDADALSADIEKNKAEIADLANQVKALNEERDAQSTGDEHIPELVDQYRNECRIEFDKKIEGIDTELGIARQKIEKLTEATAQLETKRDELKAKIAQKKSDIQKIKDEIAPLETEHKDVHAELIAMIEIKGQFSSTYEMLCEECQKKTHEHFKFDQARYDELESRNSSMFKDIEKKYDNVEAIEGEIGSIEDDEIGEIDKADKRVADAVTQLNASIANLESDRQTLENSLREAVSAKERELFEGARQDYQKAIAANLEKCNGITALIDVARENIKAAEMKIKESEAVAFRVQDATKVLKDYAAQYKEVEAKENPFDSLIEDGEKKLKTAKETIQAILKDQRKFELLANIYNEDGVKKHIVSNIVASLNVLIKKYLSEMGTDYIVVFDDKFKYTFYTSTGETDFWTFSSGERRRLDMAVMLSLRDILFTNGLVTNILVVDEVLDSGIDEFALFAILNILKNKTLDGNLGCVVISHRSEIFADVTDTFDRVTVVAKENGQSALIEDQSAMSS